MPLSALQYDVLNGGGAGPGNPYYINSTPGAIKDDVVIYTGASGTGVTTNVTGFDNAYQTPSGSHPIYASMGQDIGVVLPDAQTDLTTPIVNNLSNTWDASLLAMKTFLSGGTPIFLFNNNETNTDQTLAIWARLWITDANDKLVNRSLYLTNEYGLTNTNPNCKPNTPCPYDANLVGGSLGGVEQGNANLFDGGNLTDPALAGTLAATDFVRSGGAVTNPFDPTKTVNHNLGANQVAYAGDLPLLDTWLATLFALSDSALGGYTMHIDLRLGCYGPDWAGYTGTNKDTTCDNIQIDNGYEQLFMVSSVTNNTNVPEPATLALFGAALAGLALTRRRRN